MLQWLVLGCAFSTIADRFAEYDARVRADLGVPDAAPQPRMVIVDPAAMSRLGTEVSQEFHVSGGGGLYDPNTQTIYLHAARARDGSLYHELVHHYFRFMSDAQRSECLARLYESHVTAGSFPACPAGHPPGR